MTTWVLDYSIGFLKGTQSTQNQKIFSLSCYLGSKWKLLSDLVYKRIHKFKSKVTLKLNFCFV